MIRNPNDNALAKAIVEEIREEEADATPVAGVVRGGGLKVRRHKAPDFDKEFDAIVTQVQTRFTEIDAKLMERQRNGSWQLVHYPNLQKFMESRQVRRRVREHMTASNLRDISERLHHIAESDSSLKVLREQQRRLLSREDRRHKRTRESSQSFSLGLYADEITAHSGVSPTVFALQDTILPTTTSPMSKQQLFVDYQEMHRRSWEAATRNPIGKRICDIIPQFVLGRGVVGHIESKPHQDAWNDFAERNKLRGKLRMYLRELLMYGEIFLRYFRRPEGLIVRSLDPSTIWDIITDPEDIEDVKFYHQQFTILNTSPVPYVSMVPSTLVIRQIPAEEIDHYKINSTSSEKRGRSQLYCILGWLLRFKEFANDRVLLNKMRAMFALDVSVDGDAADVASAESQFATPPGPGAVLVHNKAVTVEYQNANNNANEAKTDAEMILKVIAVGAGVSEQFLGVSGASTRAGALIQTEPDVKNFETYQEVIDDILQDAWKRVRTYRRGLGQTTERMEFTFPALAQEDRSAKLKDLAFAEAMDWIKKERAASMGAREFGISTYDYDDEQAAIATERKNKLAPVIAQGMQQVPKIAPDLSTMPGLGDDMAPAAPSDRKVAHTSGEMGFSARRLSGRGQANTQATLNRAGFTRGGEKKAIQNKRSSGTPLRNSAAGVAKPRHVWNDAARVKALRTRRERRLQMLESQIPLALSDASRSRLQQQAATLRETLKRS